MSTRNSRDDFDSRSWTAAVRTSVRILSVFVAVCALARADFAAAADASPAGIYRPDCPERWLVQLLAKQPRHEEYVAAQTLFETPIGAIASGAMLDQISAMLTTLQKAEPRFPREEFVRFLHEHPPTAAEYGAFARQRKTVGDFVEARYAAFQKQYPPTVMWEEGKFGADRLRAIAEACGKNPDCQRARVGEWLKSAFPCVYGSRAMFRDMVESIVIANVSYGVGTYVAGKEWNEYPLDLALTNLLWALPIQERTCRNNLENAEEAARISKLSLRDQAKHFYLGKPGANGVRPGFFRTAGRNWAGYMRYSPAWAGTYVMFHAIANKFHGKETEFDRVFDDPLQAVKSIGGHMVSVMIWDSIAAVPRNILFTDFAHKFAMPKIMPNNTILVPVRSLSKIGWGAASSEVFKRYEENSQAVPAAVREYLERMTEREKISAPFGDPATRLPAQTPSPPPARKPASVAPETEADTNPRLNPSLSLQRV